MNKQELLDKISDLIDLKDRDTYDYILDRIDSDYIQLDINKIAVIPCNISREINIISNDINHKLLTKYVFIDIKELNIKDNLIKPIVEYMLFDFTPDDIERFINGDPELGLMLDKRVVDLITDEPMNNMLGSSKIFKMYFDKEKINQLRDFILNLILEHSLDFYNIYTEIYNRILKPYNNQSKNHIVIPIKWSNDILICLWLGMLE